MMQHGSSRRVEHVDVDRVGAQEARALVVGRLYCCNGEYVGLEVLGQYCRVASHTHGREDVLTSVGIRNCREFVIERQHEAPCIIEVPWRSGGGGGIGVAHVSIACGDASSAVDRVVHARLEVIAECRQGCSLGRIHVHAVLFVDDQQRTAMISIAIREEYGALYRVRELTRW